MAYIISVQSKVKVHKLQPLFVMNRKSIVICHSWDFQSNNYCYCPKNGIFNHKNYFAKYGVAIASESKTKLMIY